VSEFDIEPVPGLPEQLPEGEQLLWQGAPKWGALAVRALHVRTVATYFGLLIALRVGYMVLTGEPAKVVLLSGLWLALLCLAAVGILTLTAYGLARSTIYSITDRRVVIRFGIALTMAVNIPFKAVKSAGLRRYADGVGDIPLLLGDGHRVSYLIMWPNVRPWHILQPQPMLRCVPNVDEVAELLADALRQATVAEQSEVANDRAQDERGDQSGEGSTNGSGAQLSAAPAVGR
jgi:hypothetical protein